MDQQTRQSYQLQVDVFKALAHPMRIYMLCKLRERPWCVCELAVELGVDKSIASKHLSQLKSAGLIDDERRGTIAEYRLVTPCVLDMAACVESAILYNREKSLGQYAETRVEDEA